MSEQQKKTHKTQNIIKHITKSYQFQDKTMYKCFHCILLNDWINFQLKYFDVKYFANGFSYGKLKPQKINFHLGLDACVI